MCRSRSKSGDVEDSSSVIAEPGDIQSPEGKLANLIEAMGISYQHDMLSSDKGAFLGIGDQFVAKF